MHSQNPGVRVMESIQYSVADQNHPVFRFSCGNSKTLAKDDISSDVKEFYDRFYSVDKTMMITIGDNESADFEAIGKILEHASTNGTMSNQNKQQKSELPLSKPRIDNDLILLTDTDKSSNMSVSAYVDIKEANDLQTYIFIAELLSKQIISHLQVDLKIINSCEVGIQSYDGFAAIAVEVYMNEKGRQHPADVLAGIIDSMSAISTQATADMFDKVKHELIARNLLSKNKQQDAELATSVIVNYRKSGIMHLFSGIMYLSNYDYNIVQQCLVNLQDAKKIVVVTGQFDRELGAPNYILKFFKGNPAKDDKFGTEPNATSVFKLNEKTPILESYYAAIKLPNRLTAELLNAYVRNSRLIGSKPKPFPINQYIPNNDDLASLRTFKPSFSNSSSVLSFTSGKDRQLDIFESPVASIKALLNFDMPIDKQTSKLMSYFAVIATNRLLTLNQKILPFGSSVEVKSLSNGLLFEVKGFHFNIKAILADAISISMVEHVTDQEKRDAMQSLLDSQQQNENLYKQVVYRMTEYLRPHVNTLEDWKQFAKEEVANHFNTLASIPRLYIGYLYIEHSEADFNSEDLISPLKIMTEGKVGLINTKIRELENTTVVLNNSIQGTIENANEKGYMSCNLWGDRHGKNLASLKVAVSIIKQVAFERLRGEKKLGYVVTVTQLSTDKHLFMCLIIQGDKPSDLLHNESENFWPYAVDYLRHITNDDLRSVISGIKQEFQHPFNTRSDSADFYFDALTCGISENMYVEMLAVLDDLTPAIVADRLGQQTPRIVSIVEGLN